MGRWFFRSTASALDEKISGCRKTSSTSTFRETTTPMPSTGMTGMASRSSLNMAWGCLAVSASIAANGLSPPSSSDAAGVSSMYAPRALKLAFS